MKLSEAPCPPRGAIDQRVHPKNETAEIPSLHAKFMLQGLISPKPSNGTLKILVFMEDKNYISIMSAPMRQIYVICSLSKHEQDPVNYS